MKKKNWKRKRTNSNHVRYRNRHKQIQAKVLVLSAILSTWLPRSNFNYINNTLLTAGCCKSELRSTDIVFFVLVLWNQYSDIVSAEAGIWGFSILRVHLSFKLRGLENTILARVLFLFQERTWERPLEPFWIPLYVSVQKSTTWYQNIDNKFQGLLLTDRSARIYLLSMTSGSIVCYPITVTSRFWMCHTISWMVLSQAFLSLLPLPPPPSKISSPPAP